MKADPLQQALKQLSEIQEHLDQPENLLALKSALKHRTNFVVAKAARIAKEAGVQEVIPELLTAFDRLMKNPETLDKGCVALTEIVETLYALDHRQLDIYRRGLRHIQIEPAYGKPVDAAAKLRGYCAMGLVHSRAPEALFEILPLLVDPEAAARLVAVQALACAGSEASLLLLQLKALLQDTQPEVTGECLVGLITASFEKSFVFVKGFLDSENEIIQEAAILALGTSRRLEAFEALKKKWDRTEDFRRRKTLLAAFASLRLNEAADYLLSLLKLSDRETRVEIIRALALYRADERIRKALDPIVESWKDRTLREIYRTAFHAT